MIDVIGENILLDSNVKTKNEALAELCELLEKNGFVDDKDIFYKDVLNRERIGPTGMENGIAIPHGVSLSAKKEAIAVLRTKNDLEWESMDGNPIHLIFLLVVPLENRNTNHLKLLAKLSAALTHRETQEKLLMENDINEFKKIVLENGGN